MRLFGYARVSTSQQSLDIQLNALKEAGVVHSRIFTDKTSGDRADREGLNLLKVKVEKGDLIFVKKLDRLGRDTGDMIQLIKEFDAMGVSVRFLDDGISTEGEGLSQMERELMLERTRAGLAAARVRGRMGGRKRKMTELKVISAKKLLAAGTTPKDVASHLGVSIPTLYRWIPGAAIAQ